MSPKNGQPGEDGGLDAAREALLVSFRLLRFILIFLCLAYLASGIFSIQEHERAIVLRFGALLEKTEGQVLGPGLYFAWPYPVDEIVRFPSQREVRLDLNENWSSAPTGGGASDTGLNPELESHLLTGDLNILHTLWTARYSVSDFAAFFRSFVDADPAAKSHDAERLISNILYNVVLKVSADIPVEQAFIGRQAFQARVQSLARAELAGLKLVTGLKLDGVELVDTAPPGAVAPAFNTVIDASNEKYTRIKNAQAYATTIVTEAGGQAGRLLAQARIAAQAVVSSAEADARYIGHITRQYQKRPEGLAVFLEQLYLDTFRQAVSRADEKYILRSSGGERELRYNISRDPEALRDLEKEKQQLERAARAGVR